MKRSFTRTLTQTKVRILRCYGVVMTLLWLRRKTLTSWRLGQETNQKELTLNQVMDGPSPSLCLLIDLFIVTTIYVRKEEEKVYNALSLRELTVEELKHQVIHY